MSLFSKFALFSLPLFCLSLFTCKADFSPNADWKEIPAVYCLLDQDDSLTFVRVQKCYLGSGNLKDYASIADSSNYPQGALNVFINVWNDEQAMHSGNAPLRRLDCQYLLLDDKPAGPFAFPFQPVYCHVNQPGDLQPGLLYQLVVEDAVSSRIITTATTTLVGDAKQDRWLASINSNSAGTFNFRRNQSCLVEWCTFEGGRRYQPSVSFLYRYASNPCEIHSVSMPAFNVVSNLSQSKLSVSVSQYAYFLNIDNAFVSDVEPKLFVDSVVISLSVCNEDFHAYLNSIHAARSSLVQDNQPYSNIVGGVGVFGARRTHLVDTVLADKSDAPPSGMHYMLEQLNVGFEPIKSL